MLCEDAHVRIAAFHGGADGFLEYVDSRPAMLGDVLGTRCAQPRLHGGRTNLAGNVSLRIGPNVVVLHLLLLRVRLKLGLQLGVALGKGLALAALVLKRAVGPALVFTFRGLRRLRVSGWAPASAPSPMISSMGLVSSFILKAF